MLAGLILSNALAQSSISMWRPSALRQITKIIASAMETHMGPRGPVSSAAVHKRIASVIDRVAGACPSGWSGCRTLTAYARRRSRLMMGCVCAQADGGGACS